MWAYFLLLGWTNGVVTLLDGLNSLSACLSFEGQLSAQHGVEDDPDGPNVNFPIEPVVLLGHKALRSHVAETASIHLLYSHGADSTRDAKVDDFYLFFLGVEEEDVLQLQVSVSQVVFVAILDALHQLPDE